MLYVMRRLFVTAALAVPLALPAGCSKGVEEATVGAPPISLQRKLTGIERRMPSWVAAGGRHPTMVPLGEQVDAHLKAGRYEEAEAVADRILAMLDAKQGAALRADRRGTPVATGVNLPRIHAPGLKAFTDVMDLLTGHEMRVFGFPVNWDDVEPSPGVYALEDAFKPLTDLVPRYPALEAVVLVLRMIDTHARPMPKDLLRRRFNDPETLARFSGLLDAITSRTSMGRVTHVLIGNEVDAYLGQRRHELDDFVVFYQRAADHIRRRLPGVKVGTIVTHAGVRGWPELLPALERHSDFIDYTYYPITDLREGGVTRPWQMRSARDVEADLTFLAERAGGKPFAFTEIGCSASERNHSSETRQAEFVDTVFRVLEPYHRAGQIEFLLYHTLYDYPPEFCAPYAQAQGIRASGEFCAFVEHLGLRSHATGRPRPAWEAFVQGAAEWNKDP